MPTIASLAQQPDARFTLTCGPCNDLVVWTGDELVARVGTEETFEALKARTVCRRCKRAVDGDFVRFTFSCTSGDQRGGWSGPK